MKTRSAIHYGNKAFQRLVQDHLPILQQSPVLLVASEPAVSDGVRLSNIQEASRWVQFTLSQQFGLRMVPATISSAFPSVPDVESRLEMLRRTGSSSIVAVGSGAAIDFAKALAMEREGLIENLILVPSTQAAVVAAGSSHPLLLDPVEETLIPAKSTSLCSGQGVPCPISVSILDDKHMSTMDETIVFYASLAIILDAALRNSPSLSLDEMILEMHTYCLTDHNQRLQSLELLSDLSFRSSQLLSYGLDSEDRSIPLALASSLIPRIFPDVPVLTFWANLVPGLCHALVASSSARKNAKQLAKDILNEGDWARVPRLTVTDENMKNFSIPDMALSHIQSNTTVCKTYDLPNQILLEILKQSLGTMHVSSK